MGRLLASFVLAAAAVLCGCAVERSMPGGAEDLGEPQIINIVWSKAFKDDAVRAWDKEIASRFHRPCVALFCHGLDDGFPPWRLTPDSPLAITPAENTVVILKTAFPGRLVVLMSCNENGEMLHTKGVCYSPWPVWVYPGPQLRPGWDANGHFGIISDSGSIWDFVLNPD